MSFHYPITSPFPRFILNFCNLTCPDARKHSQLKTIIPICYQQANSHTAIKQSKLSVAYQLLRASVLESKTPKIVFGNFWYKFHIFWIFLSIFSGQTSPHPAKMHGNQLYYTVSPDVTTVSICVSSFCVSRICLNLAGLWTNYKIQSWHFLCLNYFRRKREL